MPKFPVDAPKFAGADFASPPLASQNLAERSDTSLALLGLRDILNALCPSNVKATTL